MVLNNIPLLMLLAFLLFTLVVSLYARKKATTLREYAVGNKRFHTTTLVITVLATLLGGGTLMREIPQIYNIGIIHIISLLVVIPMRSWITSLLGLYMDPFMEHLSVAETIGSIYGKYPRAITAILGTCACIGTVAIQINVISSMMGMCIDSINARILSLAATLSLTAYTMFGGVHAITITDILQFITFTIIIPLLIKFLFIKTDKSFLEGIWLLKMQEKFQVRNLFQFDRNVLNLILDNLCSGCYISPSTIHSMYMASGPIQIYKVYLRATFFCVIIVGYIVLISLLIFIGDPTLPVEAIWPYILADMSPAYKGCMILGVLGMAMSTADSYLHTAAIMVSHDMVESIRGVKAVPYIYQLRLTKLVTLVLGLLAMIVTVYYPNLFALSNFVFNTLLYFLHIAVSPPFILAILGFRGSARTALIGMTTSVLVYWVWKKWVTPETGIIPGIFPLVTNVLAMMAAHYLLPQPAGKGWIGRNDQQKRIRRLIGVFKKY